MIASQVAGSTPLRKDEKDNTAFVKRIVAAHAEIARSTRAEIDLVIEGKKPESLHE